MPQDALTKGILWVLLSADEVEVNHAAVTRNQRRVWLHVGVECRVFWVFAVYIDMRRYGDMLVGAVEFAGQPAVMTHHAPHGVVHAKAVEPVDDGYLSFCHSVAVMRWIIGWLS